MAPARVAQPQQEAALRIHLGADAEPAHDIVRGDGVDQHALHAAVVDSWPSSIRRVTN